MLRQGANYTFFKLPPLEAKLRSCFQHWDLHHNLVVCWCMMTQKYSLWRGCKTEVDAVFLRTKEYNCGFIIAHQSLRNIQLFCKVYIWWACMYQKCEHLHNTAQKWRYKLSCESSSPEVPTDGVWGWYKAGEKRQITSFKVPLRECWFGPYSKTKKTEASEELPKPQYTPNNNSSFHSPHFFSSFSTNPHPSFSPHPAFPLITTIWLPLPFNLASARWANAAPFPMTYRNETHRLPLQVAQRPRESVTEEFKHRLINFHYTVSSVLKLESK